MLALESTLASFVFMRKTMKGSCFPGTLRKAFQIQSKSYISRNNRHTAHILKISHNHSKINTLKREDTPVSLQKAYLQIDALTSLK